MIDQKKWFCDNIKDLENGMYRLSYSILRNETDAQDAVQEAIYRSYKNLEFLKDKRKFKSWIYKIITNTSFEMLKNKKDYLDIEQENVQEDKIDIDTNLTLWNAVQGLEQPYRTTITLFYYEDMSIKEISKITGTKIDAIKKQLSRGREKIKEVMSTSFYLKTEK